MPPAPLLSPPLPLHSRLIAPCLPLPLRPLTAHWHSNLSRIRFGSQVLAPPFLPNSPVFSPAADPHASPHRPLNLASPYLQNWSPSIPAGPPVHGHVLALLSPSRPYIGRALFPPECEPYLSQDHCRTTCPPSLPSPPLHPVLFCRGALPRHPLPFGTPPLCPQLRPLVPGRANLPYGLVLRPRPADPRSCPRDPPIPLFLPLRTR